VLPSCFMLVAIVVIVVVAVVVAVAIIGKLPVTSCASFVVHYLALVMR
jgi:hypothetical protein